MDVTSKEILKPKIIAIETKETEKLFQIIRNDWTANTTIQCLTELFRRQESQMQELKQELSQAKQEICKLTSKLNPPKKRGRKQKDYFLNGALVDDEELIRLIDGEFITISKLEKEVGAKKNVLRRRYERAKQKQKKKENVDRKITFSCQIIKEWLSIPWIGTIRNTVVTLVS